MNVRVRIAPSPTGPLHVGTARVALFNWLFARKHQGTYIVRIEDTDKERSKPEYEADMRDGLLWLGLAPDETYRQSDLLPDHHRAIQELIAKDRAYVSKELAKDDSGREVEVVRLRNPNTTITFTDLIRGDISFDTTELGDFVIARSVDEPLYHLAVVVDDANEGITHVIRGEDHISNTPRQILIQEALGLPRPAYAHLPLVLAPDKSKLSKRKHADIATVTRFREDGFLPDALINFVALLGWNPGTEQELFSREELIELFSFEQVQKGGAVFNREKLLWFNREYLQQETDDSFLRALSGRLPGKDEAVLKRLIPIARERVSVWSDLDAMVRDGELEYFFEAPVVEPSALVWKKSTVEDAKRHLEMLKELLTEAPEGSYETSEAIKEMLWSYAEKHGKGDVLWPLRYALTGKEKSPDPFTLLSILGKSESLSRITAAVHML